LKALEVETTQDEKRLLSMVQQVHSSEQYKINAIFKAIHETCNLRKNNDDLQLLKDHNEKIKNLILMS
jgi:hypothetical protein